jgi:hypothetical protein
MYTLSWSPIRMSQVGIVTGAPVWADVSVVSKRFSAGAGGRPRASLCIAYRGADFRPYPITHARSGGKAQYIWVQYIASLQYNLQ